MVLVEGSGVMARLFFSLLKFHEMAKYFEKFVIVDAIQYTGSNVKEISDFTGAKAFKNGGLEDELTINFPGDPLFILPTDWIMRKENKWYMSSDDEFHRSFEKVESVKVGF